MADSLYRTPDQILEELQKLIGENQTIEIHAPVDTPDGQRALVFWRRTHPDGRESQGRAVLGLDLDNALRRALTFEDDFEDFLKPERVKERDERMRRGE